MQSSIAKNKLKIAFLSVFPPFRGGISQFSSALFQALAKETEIKAFNFKRQYPKILFPGKSQYRDDNKRMNSLDNDPILDSIGPLTFSRTAKEINVYDPDLLLLSYWLPFFGPSLGSVAKRMNKKCNVISILHNVLPHEKRLMDKAFTKKFLSRNDAFIVMSDHVKNDLLAFQPNAKYIQRSHPFYSHFGDSVKKEIAQEKLDIPKGKKVLLFFGIIRKYKGLDILLKALHYLDDSFHLIVAGESYEDLELYQKIISEFKLSDKVSLFNNYIPEEDVKLYFSASDATVLPYRTATQSGISAIAYHFNTPVIATDVGGLKETIIEGKTGSIISENTPEGVAQKIKDFFPVQQNTTKEIDKLRHEYSWEGFAHALLTFSRTLEP